MYIHSWFVFVSDKNTLFLVVFAWDIFSKLHFNVVIRMWQPWLWKVHVWGLEAAAAVQYLLKLWWPATRAVNETSRSFTVPVKSYEIVKIITYIHFGFGWQRSWLVGSFNNKKTLVECTFSVHGQTSRSPVDSSTSDNNLETANKLRQGAAAPQLRGA